MSGQDRRRPSCAHKTCEKKATHHLLFRAMPMGVAGSLARPMTGAITLLLCHRHAIEATQTPEQVLTIEAKMQIENTLRSARRLLPDWGTAKLLVMPGLPRGAGG